MTHVNKDKTLLYCFMLTYNRELTLENSIKSVLSQKTKYSYKLIIIDDCSTDNSLKIATKYQSLYPDKIVVIHNDENMGILRSTFNCYKMLRGIPYFCFLDADDLYINDNHFEKCIDFLEKNKNYSVYLTNILCEKDKGKKDLWISEKVEGFSFSLHDHMNDKGVFVQTSGQFFRNTVFNNGVPKNILDLLKRDFARAYEADAFRLPLHLMYGNAVYDPSVDSIYNMVGGSFTSMSHVKQNVFGVITFCCEFSDFFTEYKTELTRKAKDLLSDIISSDAAITHKYKKYKKLFNITIGMLGVALIVIILGVLL